MSSDPSKSDESDGWFDRKENVKKILTALYIGCGVMFLIDLLFFLFRYDKHPYHNWEKWPGFYGIYGFVACVVLVTVAKHLLRPIVKQRESIYDVENADQPSAATKGESQDD